MMISRLISTAMLGALMGAMGYAPAQAEELDADEVTYASYGVMCLDRARAAADQQSLAFWTGIKSDIEPKYWAEATGNLDAVKESLAGIDPALIEKRCSEFQAVYDDPDYIEEPLSDELIALDAKIKNEIRALSSAMLRAGFEADDGNIPLKLSVQFSNRIDDRLTMARNIDDLYTGLTLALETQQSILTQNERAAVLAMSAKTLQICEWAAMFNSYHALQAGKYNAASYVLTESLLWGGLANKRKQWGGAPYVPSAAEAPIVRAVEKLSDWKTLSTSDEMLLIGMASVCQQNMDVDLKSRHVMAALNIAYPSDTALGD